MPNQRIRPPVIKECLVHYECRTLHRNDLEPDALVQAVREEFYNNGDFHRIYFGEIVSAYADEDAGQRLSATHVK
jgi:flavin reductase (DIM6/NTAB) family NADH-FMN oxidoreductase RutF